MAYSGVETSTLCPPEVSASPCVLCTKCSKGALKNICTNSHKKIERFFLFLWLLVQIFFNALLCSQQHLRSHEVTNTGTDPARRCLTSETGIPPPLNHSLETKICLKGEVNKWITKAFSQQNLLLEETIRTMFLAKAFVFEVLIFFFYSFRQNFSTVVPLLFIFLILD